MNINTRLSRSNYNLNQTQTPHFHRSYHNLNVIEQQYAPPRPPALIEPTTTTTTTTLFIQPQYEQQHEINDAYHVDKINQQQQNQWFRNNNYNNNNNSNWNKYNAYETPNFVPASFWMGSERFVKQDSSTDATWQPQQQQQRGNILDYKNQSNTIYSVYNNQNGKTHKATTATATATKNSGTNVVATTIQPMIKVRTNVQGLPYTPQPARRNTVTVNVNEQRAIQAVMPLNDILTNMRGSQTS